MVLRFKSFLSTLAVIITGVLVLTLSGDVRQGVLTGINLCLSTVIPSLFIFTVITDFLLRSGTAELLGKPLNRFALKVFNLSGAQFAVFLLSLFSGYPIGAKLVSQLNQNGKMSLEKARIAVSFCTGAGPAFIVVAVGSAQLGSKGDGVRLFLAHILSSFLLAFILGLFTRILPKYKKQNNFEQPKKSKPHTYPPFASCLVESTLSSARAMFSICSFVILFSGIGAILASKHLPLNDTVRLFLKALCEVTIGVTLFGRKELPIIAFLLGFGGLSVHFQILSSAKNLKLNYPFFLICRLIHGAFSSLFIVIFELISPRTIATLSQIGNSSIAFHGSPLASAALLLMGAVLCLYCNRQMTGLKS